MNEINSILPEQETCANCRELKRKTAQLRDALRRISEQGHARGLIYAITVARQVYEKNS